MPLCVVLYRLSLRGRPSSVRVKEALMQNPASEDNFSEDPRVSTANGRFTELGAASKPLTTQKYRPTAPGKAARRMSVLRQALCLPKTLLDIYRIVREDFSTAALDEDLWAFWGFHQEVSDHLPKDPHYRARTWQKAQLRAIGSQDVVGGLAVWEMAFMMNVAMENEDPIMEYTVQNGEGFRYLLPTLGRFMGKNEKQAKYAAEHGLPWCESAWCAEERRHSNAFARIIERLVNISPSRENPNEPMVVTADEPAAVLHIISRQVVEWNASSSYIVMAAHSSPSSDLRVLIRNIVRDEIKHLAVLSSADAYLFGPRLWRRFIDWVKLGIGNYRNTRAVRSSGNLLGGNLALSVEGVVAHLLTAFYVSKWLRTVPLRTLAAVFETPSKLPDFAAFSPSPKQQAQIDETLQEGKEKRLGLVRWDSETRTTAMAQLQFEEAYTESIEKIIATELAGFHGAEVPGTGREKAIRRQIAGLALESHGVETHSKRMLRSCLHDRLRHYQIQNNRHVAGREKGESGHEAISVHAQRVKKSRLKEECSVTL
jgi:hypothetical protein